MSSIIEFPIFITMSNAFPNVQGGGSLILAWQIRNKRVLVVGGGEVSLASRHAPVSRQTD